MPIKLTPEHVGGRVLLSNDTVHFVTDMTDTHYWLAEAGVPDESLILKLDGLDEDAPPITLLLDAPNPLDVPVPEWCDEVVIWRDGQVLEVLAVEEFKIWIGYEDKAGITHWSPAPGQMPPQEGEGKDPNEQPFDFQRSYDRGVRRFVQRNGLVTGGLHWFKDDGLFYPVRDGSGYGWTDTGHHQLTLKEHPRDLIAEAPAEVQQEDV